MKSRCLCGGVAWEAHGPFEWMSHCHCSRCRKAHGSAFGTYVMAPAASFRLTQGRDLIASYPSSPNYSRPFCRRCGSVVPDGVEWQGRVGMPLGPAEDDPGDRPMAHIFVASKAPWFEIHDQIQRFDAYPPGLGVDAIADQPSRDADTGHARGSCLCGEVAYVVEAQALRCYYCHCSRCRKARAAAFSANLALPIDGVRITRGEYLLTSYKLPEARYFRQVFCSTCGSPMPRFDPDRGFALVPMGSFDDDPGVRPQYHIFVASKAPWYEIADQLPQHAEYAPA